MVSVIASRKYERAALSRLFRLYTLAIQRKADFVAPPNRVSVERLLFCERSKLGARYV